VQHTRSIARARQALLSRIAAALETNA